MEHEGSTGSDISYSNSIYNTYKQHSAFTMVSPSKQGLQLSYKIPSLHVSNQLKTNLNSQDNTTTPLQSSFRESHSLSKNPLNLPVICSKEIELKSKNNLNCERLHFLPDIQEENTSDLNVNNFAEVVVTTCQQMDAKEVILNTTCQQSTQTLLLAVPENLSVNQLSNQTLNLDYDSQQLLQSLLQLSTASENSISVPMVTTTTGNN